MSTYPYPTNATSIANDIQFLIKNCLGPRSIKTRLAGWADQLAAESPGCFKKIEFRAALKDLLILSYCNAAINLVPAPPFHRGRRGLEIEDAGGYLAARLIIRDLVTGAPLCSTCKSDAANFVLRATDEHVARLESLLPIK
jgi:hypothetical protein